MITFFVLFIISSISFGSMHFGKIAEFNFESSIDNVERLVYNENYIHSVICDTNLYLLIDGEIDTNIVADTNVCVVCCPDSIITVTWYTDTVGTFVEYRKIFPDDYIIGIREGLEFQYCLWLDSLNDLYYIETHWFSSMYSGGATFTYDPTTLDVYARNYDFYITHIEHEKNNDYFFCECNYYGFERHANEEYSHDYSTDKFSIDHITFFETKNLGNNGSIDYGATFIYGGCGGAYSHRDDNTYNSIYGKSMLDHNSDGVIDIPYRSFRRRRVRYWSCIEDHYELTSNSTSEVEDISLTDRTALPTWSSNMFAGCFFDTETPCYSCSSNRVYYGETFSRNIELINDPDFEDNFEYLTDYNNDGVTDVYGIDDNTLYFFSIKSSIDIEPGWNLISSPYIELDDSLLSALFPFALSEYYVFDTDSNSYDITEYFTPNQGIFLLSDTIISINIDGAFCDSFTVAVKRGWNLIGGLSKVVHVNSVLEDSLIIGPIFSYSSSHACYEESQYIFPGNGFWVLSTEDHELSF